MECRRAFSRDEMRQIKAQNREYEESDRYRGCCATHNFCDANDLMANAMRTLGFADPVSHSDDDAASDAACDLWNAAWALAKPALTAREACAVLTPAQAYDVASSWGSFIRAGDPGAVFYTFRPGDARPDSERHRRQCLDYLADLLGRGLSDAARRELRALRAFFKSTGLRA